MTETKVEGRVWVLLSPDGKLYDDIDTDQIFHNRYLHITDLEEMGQYSLDNLEGWESFAQQAQAGDILLAGTNFGAGSSRQQAVDCFRALGVSAIIAESFGAIYKRNAINSGFAIIALPGLSQSYDRFENGDRVEVNLKTGRLVLDGQEVFQAEPFSRVQMDIYQAGDLFAYGKMLDQV
jgi:3-isopropylmalate/(R)-2-methylmalate dehydratase small subunit